MYFLLKGGGGGGGRGEKKEKLKKKSIHILAKRECKWDVFWLPTLYFLSFETRNEDIFKHHLWLHVGRLSTEEWKHANR